MAPGGACAQQVVACPWTQRQTGRVPVLTEVGGGCSGTQVLVSGVILISFLQGHTRVRQARSLGHKISVHPLGSRKLLPHPVPEPT